MNNPFKKHNCMTYDFRALTNPHNLARMSKVVAAKQAREKEFGSEFVVLDAVGECLIQAAWTNIGGSFALIRRIPYRTETPEIDAAMQLLIADIKAILGSKHTYVEAEGNEGSFRVYSFSGEYSIGD